MPQNYPQDLAWMRTRLAKGDKGEVRGNILPFKRGAGGELSFAAPEMLREAGIGLLDFLAGTRTGDLTPEATGLLFDVAGGGAASAPMRAAGQLGIFGGKLAKTADLDALAQAEQLAAKGASRGHIWDETGWFQGPDKQWRFEIDDSQAKVDSAGYIKKQEDDWWNNIGLTEDASIIRHRAEKQGISIEDAAKQFEHVFKRPPAPQSVLMAKNADGASLKAQTESLYATKPGGGPTELQNVVQHQQLFEAYPDLATRPYHRMGIEGGFGTQGGYDHNADALYISKFWGKGPQERPIALHELQHAVQNREGFAKGGSPETVIGEEGMPAVAFQMIQQIRQNAENTLNDIKLQAERWAFDENRRVGGDGYLHTQEEALTSYINQAAPKEVRDAYSRALTALHSINQPDAMKRMGAYIYEKLVGEVEARNVEARRNMTPEQRRVMPPWQTQEYSDEEQIVLGGKSLMQSLGY